jgi:uncharacterized membrane protein YdjX (TVP38/TMEM64 family)
MGWRRLVGLVAVALPAFVAAAILLPHSPSGLRELLLSLGPAAPALAIGAWIMLVPAMFPATLLAAAGGLAFGMLGGSALAFGGAVAGGLVAFALARFGARGAVERFVQRKPKLARLHSLLERRGFAAILAARLMPGVPAGGLHYAAGASPVRARSFAAAIATMLVAVASIALGGLAATVLLRQLRRAPATA